MVNLQELWLGNNQLKSLPSGIWSLVNLQKLDLGNNHLSSLPNGIGNLVNLQMLALCNNQLNSVPDAIGSLVNLQKLGLDHNQLKTPPHWIGNLVNLQRLYLDHNQLESLPAAVGHLPKLQGLELYNNRLITLPLDVWQFEGLPFAKVRQHTSIVLQALMAQTRRQLMGMESEIRQNLALERSLNESQRGQAIREPLYTQQPQCLTGSQPQLGDALPQGRGILQQQRSMLRQRQATQLQDQAQRELGLVQESLWQGLQKLATSSGGEAEALAPFQALVADLAQLTTISGELLQQLANHPASDPRETQASLDMIRHSLQQKQAEIGALYAPLPKEEVSVRLDLSWCMQMLTLHLIQLTTLIGESLR